MFAFLTAAKARARAQTLQQQHDALRSDNIQLQVARGALLLALPVLPSHGPSSYGVPPSISLHTGSYMVENKHMRTCVCTQSSADKHAAERNICAPRAQAALAELRCERDGAPSPADGGPANAPARAESAALVSAAALLSALGGSGPAAGGGSVLRQQLVVQQQASPRAPDAAGGAVQGVSAAPPGTPPAARQEQPTLVVRAQDLRDDRTARAQLARELEDAADGTCSPALACRW